MYAQLSTPQAAQSFGRQMNVSDPSGWFKLRPARSCTGGFAFLYPDQSSIAAKKESYV